MLHYPLSVLYLAPWPIEGVSSYKTVIKKCLTPREGNLAGEVYSIISINGGGKCLMIIPHKRE